MAKSKARWQDRPIHTWTKLDWIEAAYILSGGNPPISKGLIRKKLEEKYYRELSTKILDYYRAINEKNNPGGPIKLTDGHVNSMLKSLESRRKRIAKRLGVDPSHITDVQVVREFVASDKGNALRKKLKISRAALEYKFVQRIKYLKRKIKPR